MKSSHVRKPVQQILLWREWVVLLLATVYIDPRKSGGKRYPLDVGSGPTRSTWTKSKCASDVRNGESAVEECRWTYAFWHCIQDRVHRLTSALMPGHTKRDVTNFWVPWIPGCQRLWSESKVRCHCSGTSGQWDPVDTSQMRESVELGSGIDSTTSEDNGADCRDQICESVAWALGIAAKSKTGSWLLSRALVLMRERPSATTLSGRWMCLIVDVNWEMKSNSRAWQGECLSGWTCKAKVRGLWSVSTWNSCLSRKCQMAR